MLGTPPQIERFNMSHWTGFSQTGHVRYCCVGPHIYEYAIGRDPAFPAVAQFYVKRSGRNESGFAEDKLVAARFVQGSVIFFQMNLNNAVHHFTLTLIHSGHIDGDRSRFDPELS